MSVHTLNPNTTNLINPNRNHKTMIQQQNMPLFDACVQNLHDNATYPNTSGLARRSFAQQ